MCSCLEPSSRLLTMCCCLRRSAAGARGPADEGGQPQAPAAGSHRCGARGGGPGGVNSQAANREQPHGMLSRPWWRSPGRRSVQPPDAALAPFTRSSNLPRFLDSFHPSGSYSFHRPLPQRIGGQRCNYSKHNGSRPRGQCLSCNNNGCSHARTGANNRCACGESRGMVSRW